MTHVRVCARLGFRLAAALVVLEMVGCAAVGPDDLGEDQLAGTVCPAGAMLNGMDIAACQAANWPAVKAGGIQFAIIKATEGNGSSWYYVNPRFAGDWGGAKSVGIVRGAYHYFHPELSGKAQADFMMSIINKDGGLQQGDMPPMLDWEEPQCCGSPLPAGCGSASPSCGTPVSTMQANGMAFVNEIKALTGRDTLIYTYPWIWTYVIGAPGWAANYPLDISSFNSCPYVPGPWSNWKVWQYSTCSGVSGVSGLCGSGCVDVDHFNGDMAAMAAWTTSYGAQWVSQSYPSDMYSGDTASASLTYKNTGGTTWDTTNTRLGTTVPRDRTSAFADKSWISASRPTAVNASTPPGGTGSFDFVLHAPDVQATTTFIEHWGLVQEGVTWFGPSDGSVWFQITVHPRAQSNGPPSPTLPAGAAPSGLQTGGCSLVPGRVTPAAGATGMLGIVLLALLALAAVRRGHEAWGSDASGTSADRHGTAMTVAITLERQGTLRDGAIRGAGTRVATSSAPRRTE